jgi:hypothetical protein
MELLRRIFPRSGSLRRIFLFDRKISLNAGVGTHKWCTGSDITKGRTVKKLALTAATTAAILSSGLAVSANAQEIDQQHQSMSAPVLGEKGARLGNQCWVETWGAGSSYFGYWAPCAQPKVSKR